jgi:carbamoyltransferase
MIKWGISAQSHDAALAVMVDDELVYASHSERYSRVKNDKDLHPEQIAEAMQYGAPDKLFYYEKPWLKKWRQATAGQYNLLLKQGPKSYMRDLGVRAPMVTTGHHHSHAAYGYFTSTFGDADILVIDSIGEFETLSYWRGEGKKLTKVATNNYPDSVGLWYSAMTQRLGLKPQEHEYILMGMAAAGDKSRLYDLIMNDFFVQLPSKHNFDIVFKENLHRGCQNWRPELNSIQDLADIAAAVQAIYETILAGLLDFTRKSGNKNVVLVGGCALNCAANYQAFHKYENVWIPPNPGDAGSSVGAILAHNPRHLHVANAYLGHNIEGEYPVDKIIHDLLTNGISAVASGKAEFGPRALGNRSILADPRLPNVKDLVNKIKQRESFRPFAPAVLTEHVMTSFTTPHKSWSAPYMQYAIPCSNPAAFPGVIHIDNTSRVQTVDRDGSGFRRLLETWYKKTGCPMLLNTSLNIRGEPLVNTCEDAERWSQQYGVTVRTPK